MKKLVITAAFLFFATSAFSAVVQRPATDFPVITPVSDDYWLLTDTSNTGRFSRVATSGVRAALGLGATDSPAFTAISLGAASTTTGLFNLYGNTKAFPFSIYSQGADAPSIGWRIPSTLPSGVSITSVDASGYWSYFLLDTDLTSTSASDDTIPSAKAVKAKLDEKANALNIAFNAASYDDLTITGAEQTAGAFETGVVYVITAVGTTVFTDIGASANTIGVEFTASGSGSGTGTATPLRPIISDTTPTADKQKIAPTYEQMDEALALKLTIADIDDTPSDGNTTQPASSNSVYDGLALKQPIAGASYPSTTSTTTATGNINIDGASADHYYFNNGADAATYTPVITSPPASGYERGIVLTVGGGAGVITMTWTNVTWLGTAGAATTTTNKYSSYGCFIRNTGNAICKIIAEAHD